MRLRDNITICIVLFTLLLLPACGGEAEDKLSIELESSEKLVFVKYNVQFESVEVYEKEGKKLADIKFKWRNKRLPDPTTFYVASMFEVKQSETELKEINDQWNLENKDSVSNDVFFPNAKGGNNGMELTYELMNDSPLSIVITPTTEDEESETVIVDIN